MTLSDNLELANARYALNDGHPVLEVDVFGRGCRVQVEQKGTLLALDQVFLGSDAEGVTPDRRYTSPEGGTTLLRGYTDDPRALALYRKFVADWHSGPFVPGPVPIPSA